MTDLVEEMRNAAEFGGYEHDCPDWQGLLLAGAARIDKLQAVADRAVEVMDTVHDGYREEIDFMGLWESLVAAGLMPPDEVPDGQDRSSSGEHGPAGATGDTAEPAGPPTADLGLSFDDAAANLRTNMEIVARAALVEGGEAAP